MAATAYELLAFGLFAVVTLGSSIGVVLVRDIWHAALLLGVALLSVAVHFIMLRAEFVAAMQILVYVGGVLILVSFAVMLVRREGIQAATATHPELQLGPHLVRGLGAIALFVVFAAVAIDIPFGEPAGFAAGSITASIGYAIVGLAHLAEHETEGFLVALIVVAILLDAALDASVMLAKREAGGRLTSVVPDGGRISRETEEDES